jgi:DNA topoisomerase-6 subunit B
MPDAMEVEEQEGEDHREISVAEFFEKNKHLLGFENPQKSIITVVKEAVDNSLDACEQDDIIPEVQVLIDEVGDQKCRVELRDNAIGMDAETVPKVFGKLLYGSKFHKLQQSLLPDQKILVEKDGEVQLVEIGNLCDSEIGDMDGEKTVELEEEVKAPCFDRDTGEINWSPVTHAIRHRNRHDAYRIESSRGREIEVTGNHSLFSVEDGEKVEVEAEQLSEGDNILAPQRIPSTGQKQHINVLSQFKAEEVKELGWYVYGIEQEKLLDIKQKGEKIRKKPSPDSRKRTYYRYDGVDILKDSLETNYLDGGYLPAEKAMRMGWEDLEDLKIRTYQVGGGSTEIPARINLDEDFMRFLGLFAAEGHADERQAAFTFGSHEQELVEEVSETATSKLGAGTTTVERESNSTVFGSPLVKLMEKLCGTGARQKHVPNLLFETTERNQKAFLKGLIAGDGSNAHPNNQVSLASTSRRMAQEVSYLFNMLGVVSSWKQRTTESNISGGTTTTYDVLIHGNDYDVLIHGNDIEELGFESSAERQNRYRMLPADLVEDLRVDDVDARRVQPTRAGIYYAAGVGSSPAYAEKYIDRIEELKNSEHMEDDRYVRNLREKGLAEGYSVTDRMRSIEKRADKLLEVADSDLCLLPVENVEQIESPGYVYDISVPGTGEDENFVAGESLRPPCTPSSLRASLLPCIRRRRASRATGLW